MNATQSFIWLLLLPLVASPVIYLVGRACVINRRACIAPWIALISLLATGVPLYFIGQTYLSTGYLEMTYGAVGLKFDGISLIMSTVVLILGSLATLFSFTYMRGEDGEEKFYALLTAMIGTIIGLSCANDLFNLWGWFEAMAITSYMLVAFYRTQKASLEAGIKYLVQSATGSTIVIFGIALVFSQTGTLSLAAISQNTGPSALLLAAGAMFLIGFGVKSAFFPMHTWLPDAHAQAPSGISAMLSGIVIETGLIALLRALGPLVGATDAWGPILIGFGAANCIAGNLMALRQTQVKRLLAYSSISHMGDIVIGLGIAVQTGLINAAGGAFFHLITHAFGKGLAFLSAGAFMYALFIANGNHSTLTRDVLNGISRKYPMIAFAFSVAVLSLGGLPPLAGFMSKWQIIVSAFEVKSIGFIWLAVFVGINSVLSLGYYAPLVNRIYRHEPSEVVSQGKPISPAIAVPLVLLALVTVVLGFLPNLVTWITEPAANCLLALFGAI